MRGRRKQILSRMVRSLLAVAGAGWIIIVLNFPIESKEPEPESGRSLIRPYEIYDPRFCSLTPVPFLCEECLQKGEQIVQVVTFLEEGRPFRTYECRPY